MNFDGRSARFKKQKLAQPMEFCIGSHGKVAFDSPIPSVTLCWLILLRAKEEVKGSQSEVRGVCVCVPVCVCDGYLCTRNYGNTLSAVLELKI